MAATQLLQQAIAKLQRLPAEEQDSIASRLLVELEDELAWSERFRATTDAQWERLAAAVRQEIATNDTTSNDSRHGA